MDHQFDHEHFELIKKGIELYNNEMFWECHEELEDPWMDLGHDPVRYVFWAVIQIATSLYHVRDKNLAGAQGMLKKAKEKFHYCEKHHIESSLLEESLDWKNFKKLSFSIPDSSELEDFKKLYQFKFPIPAHRTRGE